MFWLNYTFTLYFDLSLSAHDDGYSRNQSRALNYKFMLYKRT